MTLRNFWGWAVLNFFLIIDISETKNWILLKCEGIRHEIIYSYTIELWIENFEVFPEKKSKHLLDPIFRDVLPFLFSLNEDIKRPYKNTLFKIKIDGDSSDFRDIVIFVICKGCLGTQLSRIFILFDASLHIKPKRMAWIKWRYLGSQKSLNNFFFFNERYFYKKCSYPDVTTSIRGVYHKKLYQKLV